jgi:hypothetical protein
MRRAKRLPELNLPPQSSFMLPDEQPSPEQIVALRAMSGERRLRLAEQLYWSARKMKARDCAASTRIGRRNGWMRKCGEFSSMPELDLFLLFARPLNRASIRYVVAEN